MALLNREQLNKINEGVINEAAVSWNDSILKKTGSGVINAFSWIGSSIKKGIQKRKINGLVMQWGIEYVKALQAYDLNLEVTNKVETDNIDDTDTNINNSTDNTPKLEGDLLTSFNNLYTLFSELNDQSKEFRKHFDNSTMINLKSIQEFLDELLTKVNFDVPVFEKQLKDLLEKYPNDKVLDQFGIISKVLIELGENINEDTDLYQRLQPVFPNILSKYVPAESTLPELKKRMGNLVTSSVEMIFNYLSSIKKSLETKPVEEPKKDDTEEVSKESFNRYELFYSLNEASEFTLPDNVTALFPKNDLEKFEKIDDIKQKTFAKVNIITLDTLLYEANFIINKVRQNKKSDTTADELQRIWDLGIKNVNNYFQNVIDVDKVMRSVKSGEVSKEEKSKIESTSNAIDMMAQLGLTQLSPTNASFKNKELYAFNLNILGQNGKKVNNAFLVLSPLAEFKEDGSQSTYFWFKLFGQYSVNEKNQIQRINIFNGITNNQSIIKNFNNVENAYIVALENLKVSNSLNKMWVYSNKGASFYDGKILPDAASVVDEIKRFSMKEWLKVGNIFRYYVNSRLNADKDNIRRFPGIKESDLVDENGANKAKTNHDTIINNLQK